MKCVKCGAELRLGCIYCSVCGQEAQIVSESNLLEEELLQELLSEEKKPKIKQPAEIKKPGKKKRNHGPLIISLTCLVLLLIVGITLFVVIRNRNNNSYEYQVQKADAAREERNYTGALDYYRRALELSPEDITVRFAMAELYLAMGEDNSAIQILHEIVSLDGDQMEAYRLLISLYEKRQNYTAIKTLEEGITDKALLELFESYDVRMPEFFPKPGTYEDDIIIELSAEKNCTIYFTTDGSDPEENGRIYDGPIFLDEQDTLEIKAVCKNEFGLYSEILEGTFVVEYGKPKMPTASPGSGSFSAPVEITLMGSEGSRIFYTWDGSVPTMNSAEYTGPIPVPEGNNILSAILVDKHGMISDVMKCNYRYLPAY